MISRREFCLAIGATLWLPRQLIRAAENEVFAPRVFRNGRNQTMPYRLFVPASYERREKYPLVFWLSGSAGRGGNKLNQNSIRHVIWSHVLTKPQKQAQHTCLVVAPPH